MDRFTQTIIEDFESPDLQECAVIVAKEYARRVIMTDSDHPAKAIAKVAFAVLYEALGYGKDEAVEDLLERLYWFSRP